MIPGIAPVIVSRTAAADPLAEYYGTGDGEIIVDWDFGDAAALTIGAGDAISAVANKGGSGSGYDLAGGTRPLLYGAAGLALGNGDRTGLPLASSLQLAGLHLLVVTRGAQNTVTAAGYNNPAWRIGSVVGYSRSQNNVGCTGVNQLSTGDLPPGGDSGYARYEMRLSAGEVGLYTVGAMKTYTPSGAPSFVTTHLGCTTGQGTPVDAIRRLIAVRQASGYSAASPEPAVLAARAVLQADADALNGG